MDIATSTPPSRPPGGNLPSGTAGTACPSGRTSYGRNSFCGSRSAGSAPGMGCGRMPRRWTTSGTTEATGRGSPTGTISRACATPATAARPCGNSGKDGGKVRAGVDGEPASFGRRRAAGHAQAGAGEKFYQISFTLPPVEKVLDACEKTAGCPSCRIFSPSGGQKLG